MRDSKTAETTGSRVRSAESVKLLIVAASVFVTACLTIKLARSQDQISALWLSNAFVLAAMLTSARRDGWKILTVGLLANCGADLAVGDPFVRAIPLPLFNAAEVLGCVGLLTRLRGPAGRLDLTQPTILTWFCLTILGPMPLISGLMAATLLSSVGQIRFETVLLTWYPSHALGLLAVTPLLLLPRSEDIRALKNPRYVATLAIVVAIYAVTLGATFSQTSDPLLFLLFPVAILVAFRGGFVGVIIAFALTAVASVLATINGFGPIVLSGGDIRHRILLLQLFLAVLVLTMIEVSAVLAYRTRLERDLLEAKEAAERAERERGESEARYRLIAERASDVIVRFRMDGTLT